MKNTVIIGLLAIIAGALIWIAVGKNGVTTATTAAAPVGNLNTSATTTIQAPMQAQPAPPPAQQPEQMDNRPKTTVSFATYLHDFGMVKQNTPNTFVFNFTNTGKEPLIIDGAQGSCGCTVPEYPKEPIAPGKTSQIKVVYTPSAAQKDHQEKTVTVRANTEPKETILRITANVQVDPNASAPAGPMAH